MSAEEAPSTESSSQPNLFAAAVSAVTEANGVWAPFLFWKNGIYLTCNLAFSFEPDSAEGEAVESESTAQFAPLVQLEEVEVVNLESAEEAMFKE